jgi:hypothetical protein
MLLSSRMEMNRRTFLERLGAIAVTPGWKNSPEANGMYRLIGLVAGTLVAITGIEPVFRP